MPDEDRETISDAERLALERALRAIDALIGEDGPGSAGDG
jgi:hypothetical protein